MTPHHVSLRVSSSSQGVWRTATLWAILVSSLFWLTASGWAQDNGTGPSARPVGQMKSLGPDVKPSRKSAARWKVDGFNRVIHIHQADGTDPGAKALYFYRPLLALEENPSPLPGYPPIVLRVKDQAAAGVMLTFAARLALPDFETVARFQVQQQDAEALRIQGVRPEQVKIAPWPINHAIIDCKLEGEDELLASAETDSLASIDEQIRFTLTFTADALEKFKRGYDAKELLFVFSYTFEGRKVAEGSVVSNAVKDIRTIVDQAVRSHLTPGQQNGTAPIFQQHVNAVNRDVHVRLRRVVRAQHRDLFPVLTEASSSALGRLFDVDRVLTVEELQGDKALSDAVTQYLRPLAETWATSDKRSTKLNREHELKLTEGNANKVDFGITLPIPIIGGEIKDGGEIKGGGDVESSRTTERRNLLKSEYGVEMQEDASGQYYVPYSIKVFKYNSAKQVTDIEDVQVAFLAVGEADQYLQDTPVPAHFTTRQLADLVARAGAKPRTVADTLEDDLNKARKDLDIARDRFETTNKSLTLAAAELTAAKDRLSSARRALDTASSKVPVIRKHRDDQEALVRRMPEQVPATSGGGVRGRLDGGPLPPPPMKPNPDLPAAKQELALLNVALEQAVAAEAVAKVRVEQATSAVATAQAAVEAAQRQRDAAQYELLKAEARVEVLREWQNSPPRP